jgi:pyridoxamine 5'-phosphate oxidase
VTPRHPELAPFSQPLLETDVAADPYEQFARWYTEAAASTRIVEAAALATVGAGAAGAAGGPSLRMVLVQEWDEAGFVFFTNYGSRKGRELATRTGGALLFYWDALGRQVRIEGTVEQIDPAESDAYFATRPRGAQLSAWASRQSEVVADRQALEEAAAEVARRFEGREVERPPWWGGYRLAAEVFEFWQNRDDRLHDRLRYVPAGGAWRIERLQP